ncbi:hypothetical protein [Roseovarius pelagicus]|uniref:Uncharacterized protein n=1 Tax=Roseovarius pelagicus TaxID=2980108 RepID=A0ABY6D9H3_9RHOB|nr:hypothetical protein [Roseovarius pelagicus]UXX81828.1 hypothetical protein N7U68_11905 [Roseovarius pelagicus]
MGKSRPERVGEILGYALVIPTLIAKFAIVGAIFPGSQIWFMLFSRWMEWWPEPGIIWFDWIIALILPGYAIWQTLFG